MGTANASRIFGREVHHLSSATPPTDGDGVWDFCNGRCDRCDSGDDGYGDREDVVDQQRAGGGQPGPLPKVGAGDGVRAAAVRVRATGLPIGEDHHREERDNDGCDIPRQVEKCEPAQAQDEENLFGGIGHRGQWVAAEDRHRQLLRQQGF